MHTEERACENIVRRQPDVYKPGREPLPETEFTVTLIMEFYLPELQENKFLIFKPAVFWYGCPSRLMQFSLEA